MSSPRATPALLAHVQRGRLPMVTADPTRKDIQALRPRPALEEVVFEVPLELIVAESPIQTRDPFDPEASDEDAALLDVVRQGLWTPPVVVRAVDAQSGIGASTYQIEDGHRRVAAHRLAGRLTIRAVITRHDGREADLTTLRANTFKRLPPVQQAQAIALVRERHGLEYQTIAELAGLTPRYVSELMRMLDAGDGALQAVAEGRLSVREAATLGRETKVERRPVHPVCGSESDQREGAGTNEYGPGPGEFLQKSGHPVRQGDKECRGGGFLREVLPRTAWLSADRADQLVAAVHARGVSRTEQLAALLLVAVDPGLSCEDALQFAPELTRGRVGRDVIRLLEVAIRLRIAISTGRTSARDRAMVERARALMAPVAEACV